MKKQVKSLYAQTLANLNKLQAMARHPEARQALIESKFATEAALSQEGDKVAKSPRFREAYE